MKDRVIRKAIPSRPVFAAIAVLWLSSFSPGLDATTHLTQLAHAAWTRQDGRLPSGVLCLTQTKDGFLWIGTEFGLLRFDGVRFEAWEPSPDQRLSNNYITALMAARDGGLWIGMRDSLAHWTGEKLEIYHTSGATVGVISTIIQDRKGQVWAGIVGPDSGGLCRVEGKTLKCDQPAGALTGRGVMSLLEDRQENLWLGWAGGLSRWSPDRTSQQTFSIESSQISSMAQDPSGSIWLATNSANGLFRFSDGKLVPGGVTLGAEFRPRVLLADRDGDLWIGTTGQGLGHLAQGQIDFYARTDGLSNDIVRCLYQDREGNTWVGTDGGLDRFRQFPASTLSKREGLSAEIVTSLCASKAGGTWIGTIHGLDYVDREGTISHRILAGLSAASISGILEEQNGRLWVSSAAGLGYVDHGRFRKIAKGDAIHTITSAAEDAEHNVWFSYPGGLIRARDGEISEALNWSQFNNGRVFAIEPDPQRGGLWLGFEQGGVAYWKPGQPAHWYGEGGGSGNAPVVDLHRDEKGALWIATGRGLRRLFQERITTLGTRNGLLCEQINDIVEDSDHALWLNTPCGLVQINATELAAWQTNPERKVATRVFNASDGMHTHVTPTGYFRRAIKSADGRLWFNVLDGVAMVDPRHLGLNILPPPVQIERIAADRKSYGVQSGLRLPPLIKDLEIEYTALSLADPDKVRFRYKLDGAESEWHEAEDRRQATYTNLPPNSYTFRVMACNNDGVWNESGATIGFSLPPAFYQTRWFELLCAGAGSLLLWGLYKFRLHQIAAQLNLRFQERLAERTRIARDLHDNLLQNISGIGLLLDGLSKTVTAPASAKEQLRELREETEQWLHEARESVWDLRSPPIEGREFHTALQDTADEIVRARQIGFHMQISGSAHVLPEGLQEQILKIVREAIRNAVNHGEPREILMNIGYLKDRTVELEVSDDGCGFILEQGTQKMGHWGLAGMQERARQIGAEMRISSSPESGTRISITIPFSSQKRIQQNESSEN